MNFLRFFLILIGVQHLGFLVLEMFLWTHPIGLQVFGRTLAEAQSSAVLAANQGLYNGFLAAGLFWSALRKRDAFPVQVFFLACVAVAGIFGGWTAKGTIFLVQGVPALIGLALAWKSHSPSSSES